MTTRWRLGTRVAFRFCFVYFGLYILLTQMLGGLIVLPGVDLPDLGITRPVRALVFWVAAHVFGVKGPLVFDGSGSGDKTYDWVHSFTLLTIAALATLVWSIADRRRDQYATLHKWFRLFLRFALGSTLISYGAIKAIPLQMPAPNLTRLLEPFGNFSPMGVLWYSIGASRAYEMFAGAAELLGGALLFFPRTTTLGALVCLADTIQIFALNMTYDVPVKLFSFHLILMSLVILAPDASRLANVLLLNRTAGPSTQPPLLASRRGNRIAVILQASFGAYLLTMNAFGNMSSWHEYGGGAPKSALYGIWNVNEIAVDGQIRPPLLTDGGRWRRVIFERPERVSVQSMNDSNIYYGAAIDLTKRSVTFTSATDKSVKATWSFEQPTPEELVLDGTMDGHPSHLSLRLFDRSQFLLVSRGFNWIQEYPFNR